MSLILRNKLTRPLTHDELDGNLVYLNIAEWVKKGYLVGQYVLVKSGTIGILYYCEMTHTDFIYNQYGSGNFIETYLDGSTLRRVWRQIGTSGITSGGYVTIQKDDVPLIERSVLNFVGNAVNVTDDAINGRTIVTIDGSGGNQITGGTTNAGDGGTNNIIQTIKETGGGTIIIDLAPAFTFKNPNPVKKTVGGIEEGETPFFGGKTIHQIIQEIFYPATIPTITYSSLVLNREPVFNENLKEIGYNGDLTLRSNFTLGESVVTSNPTKFMGFPITYRYTGKSITTPIINVNDTLIDFLTLFSYTVTVGLNDWLVLVHYGNGEQPIKDDGSDFIDPQFTNAGSITATTSFEGVYPIFATTTNIITLTKQPLYSMLFANNIELVFVAEPEDNSGKHKFDIPNIWLNNRPLIKIEYFNTISNQFDLQDKINEFDVTQTTHIIQGDVINYTRFTHTGLATGLRRIKLIFTN
jgi:hypothetical protein